MNSPACISHYHRRSTWNRVVETGFSLIAQSKLAGYSVLNQFRTKALGANVASHQARFSRLRKSTAPVVDARTGDGPISEGSLCCVSGLDGLSQLLDARSAKTKTLHPMPCIAREADIGASKRRDTIHEFPELTGVWFSQGCLRGKVNLSNPPKRGWFELYVTEAN